MLVVLFAVNIGEIPCSSKIMAMENFVPTSGLDAEIINYVGNCAP